MTTLIFDKVSTQVRPLAGKDLLRFAIDYPIYGAVRFYYFANLKKVVGLFPRRLIVRLLMVDCSSVLSFAMSMLEPIVSPGDDYFMHAYRRDTIQGYLNKGEAETDCPMGLGLKE